MQRKTNHRRRIPVRSGLRIEFLEQRLAFALSPGAIVDAEHDSAQNGPIVVQPFESEDVLRQALLDNATRQWESIFGTEVRNSWPRLLDAGAAFLPAVAEHAVERLDNFVERLPLNRDRLDVAETYNDVLARTDGDYLFLVSDENKLTILDVRDPAAMKAVATVGLESTARDLYVIGDRLVVVGRSINTPIVPDANTSIRTDTIVRSGPITNILPIWDPRFIVTVYDIADRAQPAFVSRTMIEGDLIQSQADENSIIFVTGSGIQAPHPKIECERPDENENVETASGRIEFDPTFAHEFRRRIDLIREPECRYEWKEDYVARVSETIVADSLPTTFTEFQDAPTTRGLLVQPEDISWNGEEFGRLVSIVSFGLDAGISGTAGVLSSGDSLAAYFSPDHVYVASSHSNYFDVSRSHIHQFTVAEEITLSASAEFAGRVSSPFAMNELGGHLRLATSEGWGVEQSENVFVLDVETLTVVGSLMKIAAGDLASTRFIGSQAFLISHLPLHEDTSIDLSDPTDPKVVGEIDLAIPSSVLFPLDDGFLIDVGRDRDPSLEFEQKPTVSLLNVQDLAAPVLVDREMVGLERENWLTFFAGQHSVNYNADLGVLTVAFKGNENFAVSFDVVDKATALGRRLVDALNLDPAILQGDDLGEIVKNLPEQVKELLEQLPNEVPSADKIGEIIESLPAETRERLKKASELLPDRLKSLAAKFLGEGEERRARRANAASGLSVFDIDPTAENPENAIELLGTISHEKSIRQSLIIGDVLFAISGDTVTAHDAQHPDQQLDKYYFGQIAFDDTRVVAVERGPTVLDVLTNDRVPESAKIARVSATKSGGTVAISEDGRSILYTSPAEIRDAKTATDAANRRSNYDEFEYTVHLEDGTRGQAVVTVHLVHEQPGAHMARLAVADLARHLEIAPERIEILRVEPHRWRDGCLGITLRDAACTQAIVPGFIVWLSAQGQRFEYHTDNERHVVLVERPVPNPDDDPNRDLVLPDEYRIAQESSETKLDVLANDFPGIAFIRAPQITAVSETSAGGKVRIGENGLLLYYTPPANFVGRDTFSYTVDNGPSARVIVHVVPRERVPDRPDDNRGDLIDVQLEITDEAGSRIRTAEIGQTFYVNVYVDDLRRDAKGVYGAYLDLAFDHALAQVAGEIDFNETYPNGTSGAVLDSLIDEVGAFTDSIPHLGDDQQLLVRIPFEAVAEGKFTLRSNPADERPAHEMTLFGINHAIALEDVHFGDASLEIVNGFHNETEPSDVNGDASVTPMDALNVINAINENGVGEVRAKMRDYLQREAHAAAKSVRMYFDVNKDRFLTALDPLFVINRLNRDTQQDAERLRLERAENAALNNSENGRSLDNILVVPSDLGQRRDESDPQHENGRSDERSRNTSDRSEGTGELYRPNANANGRGEGESMVDDSIAEIAEGLCRRHQSSSDVDDFFANLGN